MQRSDGGNDNMKRGGKLAQANGSVKPRPHENELTVRSYAHVITRKYHDKSEPDQT